MRILRLARPEHGFALSELLVACAIIGFVMAGLLGMLQSGQQSYLVGSRQAEAQQTARLAIDRMVQEIRNGGYCPTCANPGVTPFNALVPQAGGVLSANSVVIQNDWDGTWNGTAGISAAGTVNYTVMDTGGTVTTTQRGERIIYAYTSATGTLTRQEVGVDAAAVTVATGISSLTFSYLDSGDPVTNTPPATTNDPARARTVVIALTTQPAAQGASTSTGKVEVAMADSVRLRNR